MSKVFKSIGGVTAAVLALVIYGTVIEPRLLLDDDTYEAWVANLPTDWEGEQIALLADFQIGMWWDNDGMVAEAVEEVIEQNPAALLIAGDFVYEPDSVKIRRAVDLMRPLPEAGIRVYAVLGNHDYSVFKEESAVREELSSYLTEELEAAGIQVLFNESVAVPARNGGEPLHMVGIDSKWADRADPTAALAGLAADAPRVVFAHNPALYRDMPADAAPLMLAGHTHGGQIRLPILSISALEIAKPGEVFADSWAATSVGARGNNLYVSRGIGFSNIPVRLFCRPELTYFTLRGNLDDVPKHEPGIDADDLNATVM